MQSDVQSEWLIPAVVFSTSPSNLAGDGNNNSESVAQLNSFLRSEISATEIYRMAVDKLIEDECEPSQVSLLRESQHEHIRAGKVIRGRIAALGGTADASSGMWGTWARIAQGAAQLFGDSAALHSLKEGEEHALRDMLAGLKNLDADSIALIESDLLPGQQKSVGRVVYLIDLIGA